MKRGGGVSGAVSLVMIFCVLCLAVFSVLTLATADRERNLAELTAQSAADYYAADALAVHIVAALREGGELPGDIVVNRSVSTSYEGGSTESASFTVPIGDEQGLEVEVMLRDVDGSFRILRWQTVYTGGWETDDTLELWDGDIY